MQCLPDEMTSLILCSGGPECFFQVGKVCKLWRELRGRLCLSEFAFRGRRMSFDVCAGTIIATDMRKELISYKVLGRPPLDATNLTRELMKPHSRVRMTSHF